MFNLSINIRLIFFIFIIKVLLAIYFPLINDEAYTIAVSKSMSLSFFDHPPVAFWLPLFFHQIFEYNSIFIYRLPFLLISLTTTFMIYLLGKEFGGKEIGVGSALLYNIAPFYFFSGGILIVPDGPLNLGIITTAYCILKLHKVAQSKMGYYFVLLGLSLCLCFASKYQGYLIGIGCLLVLFFSNKRNYFLKNPLFYISVFLALTGILPPIIWNIHNDWVSFNFHSSRQGFSIQAANLIFMHFALMIYLLPHLIIIPGLIFINFLGSLSKITCFKESIINSATFQLAIISLPNLIMFNFIFLTSKGTFPHWVIPGWLLFLPIIVKYLHQKTKNITRLTLIYSVIFIWFFLLLLIAHSQFGILTNHKKEVPKWDNTLELINWRQIRSPLEQIIAEYSVNSNIKLAAFTWTEAGQFSTLMDNKYETLVIEGDPHHFQFMKKNKQKKPTILVKITLGLNADTNTILFRVKKYDKDAYHIENIKLKRGNKIYANASLFFLNI